MYARVSTESLHDLLDSDLVRRFKAGDDDALEVLLQRHADDLYRFCRHLVAQREDAEDIYQESIVRAIDRVDSLQSESAFRGWLFRIARNLSVDSFRSKRRTMPLPEDDAAPRHLHVDGPQDHVEVGEEHQTVAHALSRLVPSHRNVLVLREVEGLSYAEIAHHLNVSQSAVETLLFRARRRLREEYSKGDSRILGLFVFGGLRALGLRLAAPLAGGTSTATKVALTAAIIGGTVATGPHVFHSRTPGFNAFLAERRSGLELGSSREVAAPVSRYHSHSVAFAATSVRPYRPAVNAASARSLSFSGSRRMRPLFAHVAISPSPREIARPGHGALHGRSSQLRITRRQRHTRVHASRSLSAATFSRLAAGSVRYVQAFYPSQEHKVTVSTRGTVQRAFGVLTVPYNLARENSRPEIARALVARTSGSRQYAYVAVVPRSSLQTAGTGSEMHGSADAAAPSPRNPVLTGTGTAAASSATGSERPVNRPIRRSAPTTTTTAPQPQQTKDKPGRR